MCSSSVPHHKSFISTQAKWCDTLNELPLSPQFRGPCLFIQSLKFLCSVSGRTKTAEVFGRLHVPGHSHALLRRSFQSGTSCLVIKCHGPRACWQAAYDSRLSNDPSHREMLLVRSGLYSADRNRPITRSERCWGLRETTIARNWWLPVWQYSSWCLCLIHHSNLNLLFKQPQSPLFAQRLNGPLNQTLKFIFQNLIGC